MISFCSVTQAPITKDSIALLAEASYDKSILGSNSSWIVMPYLAKPYGCSSECQQDNQEQLFSEAVRKSSVASIAIESIVQLSHMGKDVVIGCYAYDAGQSHLTQLMDIIEERFSDNVPEMTLERGKL